MEELKVIFLKYAKVYAGENDEMNMDFDSFARLVQDQKLVLTNNNLEI